jgi:hypothetical protein
MESIFTCKQQNESTFRAQLINTGVNSRFALWITESEEENYVRLFDSVLGASLYSEKDEYHNVIILLRDVEDEEEPIFSVTIGKFQLKEATDFIAWLKTQFKR